MAIEADSTNSFVTVTEADTYFGNQYNRYTEWNKLLDEDKSRLLIEATSIMIYYIDWSITIDPDDPGANEYVAIENACCEMAWALKNSDRQTEPENLGLEALTVESIALKFDKTDRAGIIPENVTSLIRDYITSAPGALNVPVERA